MLWAHHFPHRLRPLHFYAHIELHRQQSLYLPLSATMTNLVENLGTPILVVQLSNAVNKYSTISTRFAKQCISKQNLPYTHIEQVLPISSIIVTYHQ